MTPLDRRSFLRTLLAAAASSTAYARSAHTACTAGDASKAVAASLTNGDQQLRFSAAGALFTFQNFLRSGNEWKPATLANSLIAGPSFSLLASRVDHRGSTISVEGAGQGEGLDGRSVNYGWQAEISALASVAGQPWFRFHITLHLPVALKLRERHGLEPQIITWLSSTSTLMEGQSGSWQRVVLEQPTRNSLGTYGNDLPATYLLDQSLGVETMMYFDVDDMGWMSVDNLPRFLVYRCSSISEFAGDGTQRLGVGLVSSQATGNTLPAGDVSFTFYLLQRPLNQLLTEQDAVTRWIEALLPLFKEQLDWPSCATNWQQFAAGTVSDLQQASLSQVSFNGHTGLRAYAKASSQIWTQPDDNFELMTMADVLWPSLLYLRLHPEAAYAEECRKLVASMPGFYHADTHSISNDYVRPKDERADSWYPFENALVKYPMIGALSGSKDLTANFLEAFRSAHKLADRFNYLFPIYYQTATFRAEGAGSNYAIGGLYAWGGILAARLTGDTRYRDEARRAIQVLYNVPAGRLFHEPQELGFAALAAAELGMHDETKYLLSEQLRMFYWFSDPSQKTHHVRGMVQAAASILYPAFKENVEAILPWTGIARRGMLPEGMLRFMDQQRRNNFSFFETCLHASSHAPAEYIPYENLGTLELNGQTGNVGKEIYGSGESLWMYLMFEALGQTSDRELMLLNLDLLDVMDANSFPPRQLNFILFNPDSKTRSSTIHIPPAAGREVRLTAEGRPLPRTLTVPAGAALTFVAEY